MRVSELSLWTALNMFLHLPRHVYIAHFHLMCLSGEVWNVIWTWLWATSARERGVSLDEYLFLRLFSKGLQGEVRKMMTMSVFKTEMRGKIKGPIIFNRQECRIALNPTSLHVVIWQLGQVALKFCYWAISELMASYQMVVTKFSIAVPTFFSRDIVACYHDHRFSCNIILGLTFHMEFPLFVN